MLVGVKFTDHISIFGAMKPVQQVKLIRQVEQSGCLNFSFYDKEIAEGKPEPASYKDKHIVDFINEKRKNRKAFFKKLKKKKCFMPLLLQPQQV